MKSIAAATTLLACSLWTAAEAFVVRPTAAITKTTNGFAATTATAQTKLFGVDAASSSISAEQLAEADDENAEKAPANPDYPNLPEVKGDFDWDAKYGGDDDWITDQARAILKPKGGSNAYCES